MDGEAVVVGSRGVMVMMGMGQPISRAFVVASIVGLAAYAMKAPAATFDEDGQMRPFKLVSQSPEATYSHFLLVPLTAGAIAYVFT